MKFFNRQSAAYEPAAIPFSLAWRDPDGRLTLDIRFRFLRECFHTIETAASPTFGLLLGSEDSGTDNDRRVRIVEAQALPFDVKEIRSCLQSWHESSNKHLSVVGFYIEPAIVTSGMLSQYLETCREFLPGPVLLLEFNRDASVVCLKQWNPETSNITIFPLLFASHWMRLRQQNYAPFEPFYFNTPPPGGPADIPPAMMPQSAYQTQHGSAEVAGDQPATVYKPLQLSPQGSIAATEPSLRQPARGITITPGAMMAVFSVVLAVLAGVFWWSRRADSAGPVDGPSSAVSPSASHSAGLNLEVVRRGRDLQIMWDRHGSVIQNANVGLLQITEGGRQSEIVLPARQLKTGQVMYLPKTGDIELELHVITPSGLVREMVRVIEAGSAARFPQQALIPDALGATSDAGTTDRLLSGPPSAGMSEPDMAGRARNTETGAAAGATAAHNPAPATHTEGVPRQSDAARAASPERTAFSFPPRSKEPQASGREIRTIFVDPPPPLTAANTAPVSPLDASHALPNSLPSSAAPPRPEPAAAAIPPASQGRSATQPLSSQLPAGTAKDRAEAQLPQPTTPTTAGYTGPVALSQSLPVVPTAIQRMLTREITIEVTATINEEGRVVATSVPATDGKTGYLASLAKESVTRWRFQPATSDGKPVRSQHIVRFRFAP